MSNVDTITGDKRARVWVLSGFKAGDTAQLVALADALPWDYEVKRFVYQKYELLTNRLLGITLAGIDARQSNSLQPPWPDLVLTAGRRNEPIARWIKQRAAAQIVHIGRPWAALQCFDLVVTTPQYFLPSLDNVIEIGLPLHSVTDSSLGQWKRQWQSHFRHLPRPFWSVLLGGDSGPFVFTRKKMLRLAGWLMENIKREGGSLLVTNSPRTPPEAYRNFLKQIDVPCYAYHWRKDDEDNPYQGYLAHADRLVATGESMSMLAEANATGVPLFIFDLSDCPQPYAEAHEDCKSWWRLPHNYRYRPMVHRLLMCIGPRRMRRDITNIQRQLVAGGVASWVGQPLPAGTKKQPARDMDRVVMRVLNMFEPAEMNSQLSVGSGLARQLSGVGEESN